MRTINQKELQALGKNISGWDEKRTINQKELQTLGKNLSMWDGKYKKVPTSGGSSISQLVFDGQSQRNQDIKKQEASGISVTMINDELKSVNSLQNVLRKQRLFTRPLSQLDRDRNNAEKQSRKYMADLANYIALSFKDEASALTALNKLQRLKVVATVYFPPIPRNADIPPVTNNLGPSQGYLNSSLASNGIDALYAWQFQGGHGELVRIIDIEAAWNLEHEDLPSPFVEIGINAYNYRDQVEWITELVGKSIGIDHGTAVLGEMVSMNDGTGVTGIAYNSEYGYSSVINGVFANTANAVNMAVSSLNAGDIILIEQHAKGPGSNAGCNDGNCGQWRFVAMEYWQAEYDAIANATAQGIIVVEAAGNGGQNLDNPRYQGKFIRTVRDSGAIIVGAGTSNNRAPMAWSNNGTRIDVQGWGQNVMTLGYGRPVDSNRFNGDDSNQWYTGFFNGTSSASPIVVGAAAVLQGINKSMGAPPITPSGMRSLLAVNGTPQTSVGSGLIGPLPNLRSTLNNMGITLANQAAQTTAPDGTCTTLAVRSGECGGNACVRKPAGVVGGDCFLGFLFCTDTYVIYHTDQFVCAETP